MGHVVSADRVMRRQVLLDLVAFYLAPQRLISPLGGGLVVFFNLFLSSCMLGEKTVWQDYIICAFIVTGAFLVGEALVDEVRVRLSSSAPCFACATDAHTTPLVVCCSQNDNHETYDVVVDRFFDTRFTSYLFFCAILAAGMASVIVVKPLAGGEDSWFSWVQRKLEPAAVGIMAGLLGGQQYLTKLGTQLFHSSCHTPWKDSPFPYLILFVGAGLPLFALIGLNMALKRHDALYIMPSFQATVIAIGVVSAGAFWGGVEDLGAGSLHLYYAGVATIVLAVMMLTTKESQAKSREVDSGEEAAEGEDAAKAEEEMLTAPAAEDAGIVGQRPAGQSKGRRAPSPAA